MVVSGRNVPMEGFIGDHLGGCHPIDSNTWMPDIWERLIFQFQIKSVLDIGCGYGASVKWWHDRGLKVLGIEGWRDAIAGSKVPELIHAHDYTMGPYIPHGDWDLAWSAEFLEHVEEQFIPNFMITFARCRYAVTTHAYPGQTGHHHVNEQKDEYWEEKFEQFGFKKDHKFSEWMRGSNVYGCAWGRNSLTMYVRQ